MESSRPELRPVRAWHPAVAVRWPIERRRSSLTGLIVSSVVAGLLVASLALFAPAAAMPVTSAATTIVDTSMRTEVEIRSRWDELRPTYTGTPYVVVPSVVAPYAPGETSAAFRDDGLKMLNFGRYLAGLPSDVTLNDTRNLDAQYGAVLLTKEYSHTPAQPADMSLDFYQRGYASTSRSNIGYGYSDLESFEKDLLYDGHSNNVDRVGHRRWILNPGMLYTGVGYAGTSYPQRMTTYALDNSRPTGEVDYAYIAWPSAGLFPVEFASQSVPWSVTLNPKRYDWDATRVGHTVTLRRVSDDKSWTFDAADTDSASEYFNAEFSNYGYTGNAFIFRPKASDLIGSYKAGEQYDVTLSGGIYAEGTRTPVTVKYRTSLCLLSGAATVFGAPTTIPDATPPPTPNTPAPPTTFTRFSGSDRFATAILASKATFAAGSCNAVVIATGMNYPDALSGAGLAGAANAPILLVGGDVLRADVKAEIKRVTQGKASFKVYILGSAAAVTAKMEASIKASLTGESVERFSGANRYATAQLVAAKVKALQGTSFGTKAILVSGLDYVDGLLVGPAAFASKVPILLVGTTADTALKNTLKSLGTKDLVVLGTTARMPVAVETALKSAVSGLTTRRASNLTDTYARSAAAAEYFANPANGFGLTWAGIGIATAETFPDGLGAGCVEGKLGTSLLLTKTASLPTVISTKITAHKAAIRSVRFYGSTSAVSGAAETSVRNLLK